MGYDYAHNVLCYLSVILVARDSACCTCIVFNYTLCVNVCGDSVCTFYVSWLFRSPVMMAWLKDFVECVTTWYKLWKVTFR